MEWPDEEIYNFECPRCLILSNDPLNQIEEILVEPSILISEHNYRFDLEASSLSHLV